MKLSSLLSTGEKSRHIILGLLVSYHIPSCFDFKFATSAFNSCVSVTSAFNALIFATSALSSCISSSSTLKAKLACHPARCLLPVEIIERCGLATGPVYCRATAIFIALLIR